MYIVLYYISNIYYIEYIHIYYIVDIEVEHKKNGVKWRTIHEHTAADALRPKKTSSQHLFEFHYHICGYYYVQTISVVES